MTIEQMFNNFSNAVVQCVNDVKDGKCWENFNGMSDGMKGKTLLKVAAAAAAAGLLVGLLTGSAIVGVVIAGIVGIAAFVYLTSSEQYGYVEKGKDFANEAVSSVKNEFNKGIDTAKDFWKKHTS